MNQLLQDITTGLSIGTVALCLALMLMGCSGEGPTPTGGISVNGNVVTVGDADCTVRPPNANKSLRQCGLTAAQRARALGLLLSQEKLKNARQERRQVSQEDIVWAARAIYSETNRSEEMELVGTVIANRLSADQYPNTVREVVRQPWAFTAITRGTTKALRYTMDDYEQGDNRWRRAVRMAEHVLSMPDSLRPLDQVTHFYSPVSMASAAPPEWAEGERPEYEIGDRFRFYKHSATR